MPSHPTAPFSAIENMLTDVTMSMLSNVVVTPVAGADFPGIFSEADDGVFDAVLAGEITLRYPLQAASLQRGDLLTLRGAQYRVAEKPRRIGVGHEAIAVLIEVPA